MGKSTSRSEGNWSCLFEAYKVRNTFIHIQDDCAADERAVQSMPHGIFSQCLTEEIVPQHSRPLAVSEEGAGMPWPQSVSPGTQVVIEGLSKSPAFNGLHGVVQSWDDETNRYSILLASPACGRNWAKVKSE